MQTGRRDEDAHEQQHPPDESDGKEQDGQEAKCADSPEVVRGYLVESNQYRDSIIQQSRHLSYRRIIGIQVAVRVRRVVSSQQPVPFIGLSSRPLRARPCAIVRTTRCGVCLSVAIYREVFMFILAVVVLLVSPQSAHVVRLPAASVLYGGCPDELLLVGGLGGRWMERRLSLPTFLG